MDGQEFSERLLRLGVPAGAVLDTGQVVAHPHTAHRGMLPVSDWYQGPGTPIKFTRTPGSVRRVPPRFAADADEILREAGYSDEEIVGLKSAGATLTKRRR